MFKFICALALVTVAIAAPFPDNQNPPSQVGWQRPSPINPDVPSDPKPQEKLTPVTSQKDKPKREADDKDVASTLPARTKSEELRPYHPPTHPHLENIPEVPRTQDHTEQKHDQHTSEQKRTKRDTQQKTPAQSNVGHATTAEKKDDSPKTRPQTRDTPQRPPVPAIHHRPATPENKKPQTTVTNKPQTVSNHQQQTTQRPTVAPTQKVHKRDTEHKNPLPAATHVDPNDDKKPQNFPSLLPKPQFDQIDQHDKNAQSQNNHHSSNSPTQPPSSASPAIYQIPAQTGQQHSNPANVNSQNPHKRDADSSRTVTDDKKTPSPSDTTKSAQDQQPNNSQQKKDHKRDTTADKENKQTGQNPFSYIHPVPVSQIFGGSHEKKDSPTTTESPLTTVKTNVKTN